MELVVLLTLLLIPLTFTGCSDDSSVEASESRNAWERTKEHARTAGESFAELLSLQGEKFRQAAEQQLADVGSRIAEARESLKDRAGDAAATAREELDALAEKRKELAARLDEVQDATGRAWEDLKQGIADGLAEIDEGLERASADEGVLADEGASADKGK